MQEPSVHSNGLPPLAFSIRHLAQAITIISFVSLAPADASTVGQSISLNLGSNLSSLAPTDVTGVIPSRNWMNAPDPSGSITGLTLDNLGVATVIPGSSVSWSGSGTWSTNQEDNTSNFSGADEIMMAGYLDVNEGAPGSILFAGLPNGLYDVYVYTLTAVNTRDSGNIVVNGVQEKSISMFSTSFVEGGGPGGALNVGGIPGNYNLYSNVNVADGAISITMPAGTFRTAVNGVEIVAVPEPSSALLLAICGAGVAGIRRRRRSA